MVQRVGRTLNRWIQPILRLNSIQIYGFIVAGLLSLIVMVDGVHSQTTSGKTLPVVGVALFENATKDPQYDWMGVLLSYYLYMDFSYARNVAPIDFNQCLFGTRAYQEHIKKYSLTYNPLSLLKQLNANVLIYGSYSVDEAKRIHIQAYILQAHEQTPSTVVYKTSGDAPALVSMVDILAQQVITALQGRFELGNAIEPGDKLLEIIDQHKDFMYYAQLQSFGKGWLKILSKDYLGAIKLINEELNKSTDTFFAVKLLKGYLLSLQEGEGSARSAQTYLESIIPVSQQGYEFWLIDTYLIMAGILYRDHAYYNTIQALQKSEKLLLDNTSIDNPIKLLEIYELMYLAYLHIPDYGKAEHYLAQVAKINQQIGFPYHEDAHHRIDLAIHVRDFSQMNRVYDEYQTLLKDIGETNPRMRAAILNNIGEIHRRKERFTEAKDAFQEALSIYGSLNDSYGLSQTTNNLALVYLSFQIRDFEAVSVLLNKALTYAETTHSNYLLGIIYHNFGLLYLEQGFEKQTFEYLNKSIEVKKEHLGVSSTDTSAQALSLAYTYMNLGRASTNWGDLSNAHRYYDDAMRLIDDSPINREFKAEVLFWNSILDINELKYDDAKRKMLEAKDLFKSIGNGKAMDMIQSYLNQLN